MWEELIHWFSWGGPRTMDARDLDYIAAAAWTQLTTATPDWMAMVRLRLSWTRVGRRGVAARIVDTMQHWQCPPPPPPPSPPALAEFQNFIMDVYTRSLSMSLSIECCQS